MAIKKKIPFIFIIYFITNIGLAENKNTFCNILDDSLKINLKAYKNCLIKKPTTQFSRNDLNECKRYYLSEVERLSYVFKNVCK